MSTIKNILNYYSSRVAEVRTTPGMVIIVVFVAMGLSPIPVYADTKHCSLELQDSERDSCYQSNPDQLHQPKRTGWSVIEFPSHDTGELGVSVVRTAKGKVLCGSKETTATIALNCTNGRPHIVVTTGCKLGEPDDSNTLLVRAGATSTEWATKVIRNSRGIKIDDSTQADEFIQSLVGQSTVALLITPQSAPVFAATIELDGYEKGFKRINSLCVK